MPSDIFGFATVKMDLKKKMYVYNILWIYNACFEFVLKYVALIFFVVVFRFMYFLISLKLAEKTTFGMK